MATRIGSGRRKTKHKMRKPVRQKGKISLTRFFAEYDNGDRVVLKAEPAYQKGNYHGRFHGKSGIISGMKGRCYIVTINDQGKDKKVIVHPVHLIAVKK
ncbi:MAG: 50S ribosomal protein L21e [Nanoarchaeota archaeon]|nr:50S ribosomal protein L21e [Nanoarchaeota archaeon]